MFSRFIAVVEAPKLKGGIAFCILNKFSHLNDFFKIFVSIDTNNFVQ